MALADPADPGRPSGRTGLYIVSLDRDLLCQQANQEFLRRFGDSSASVRGRSFRDLVHPGVRQTLTREFSRLLDGGRQRFTTRAVTVGQADSMFTGSLTAVAVSGYRPGAEAILVFMRCSESGRGGDVLTGRQRILSALEARILEGIASGLSTVPLAAQVYLSRQGVEYHVTRLLRKFKVANRPALISRAYSMGLLNVGAWPPKVVKDFVG